MACAIKLQKVRDMIKKPIIITSAYRTKSHNAAIGGALHSQHLTASAVDSHTIGLNLLIYLTYLARYATGFNGFCIGNEKLNDLVHADLRKPDKFWVDVYK